MLRVDNIPLLLKPAFHAYGYAGAASMEVMFRMMRSTVSHDRVRSGSSIEDVDDTNTSRNSYSHHASRIDCVFHENLPMYMATYLPPDPKKPRHVWMNHPHWRMHPIHVWLKWNGVDRLFFGSTGHGGQDALDGLVQELQSHQYSTLIAVDGPSGPPHEVKRGALDLSLATGLPLIGISFKYEHFVRAPGWDGKYYPIIFSWVKIKEGGPIFVTEDNYSESRDRLRRDLMFDSKLHV